MCLRTRRLTKINAELYAVSKISWSVKESKSFAGPPTERRHWPDRSNRIELISSLSLPVTYEGRFYGAVTVRYDILEGVRTMFVSFRADRSTVSRGNRLVI